MEEYCENDNKDKEGESLRTGRIIGREKKEKRGREKDEKGDMRKKRQGGKEENCEDGDEDK